MSEFWKVIKTLLFAILVTLFLQIKYKNTSLEQRLYSWIAASRWSESMEWAAQGGALLLKNTYKEIQGWSRPTGPHSKSSDGTEQSSQKSQSSTSH